MKFKTEAGRLRLRRLSFFGLYAGALMSGLGIVLLIVALNMDTGSHHRAIWHTPASSLK
tara:strand:+ start:356 stop:532 length:177 start_codon:yes stop_codon:yes gene_type:complete